MLELLKGIREDVDFANEKKLVDDGILDSFDILSNYVLLPIVAIITCVIAGWFIDKTIIPKEIGLDKNKALNVYFNVIIKYVAPICIFIILVSGLLAQFGVIVL